MNKGAEESVRCKLYFILFLNKDIAPRNIGTVSTTAWAAGPLPIEKQHGAHHVLFFFLLQLLSSACPDFTLESSDLMLRNLLE